MNRDIQGRRRKCQEKKKELADEQELHSFGALSFSDTAATNRAPDPKMSDSVLDDVTPVFALLNAITADLYTN